MTTTTKNYTYWTRDGEAWIVPAIDIADAARKAIAAFGEDVDEDRGIFPGDRRDVVATVLQRADSAPRH